MQLTDTETKVLDFERSWWKYAGAKESAIHDAFGWSPTRHYQVLNELLDRPEALAYDPMLVRRLLRIRASRQTIRTGSRGARRGAASQIRPHQTASHQDF